MPSTERDIAQEIVRATGRSIYSARCLTTSLDAGERASLVECSSPAELAIALQVILDARADTSAAPADDPDHQ